MLLEKHCWAEVSLDALRENFRLVQAAAGGTPVMAVVKANAYGHGDTAVAQLLEAEGAAAFAVADFAEALRLRRAQISRPILILGWTDPACSAALAVNTITQAAVSLEHAKALSYAALHAGVTLNVHLKVDTGMGRVGFAARDDMERAVAEMEQACHLPNLVPAGIFTHFAVADSAEEDDAAYTAAQHECFSQAVQRLAALGCRFSCVHCCNSAGTFLHREYHHDMVRAGIILYGQQPSAQTQLPGLCGAMKLKARVALVKELLPGDAVSYGRTFRAGRPMRAATLTAGYADGYPRLLSNKGVVSIHGRPAPVLGRVCMDQMVVDVTDISEVRMGDEAVLLGGEGSDSFFDAAQKTGTISYELVCSVARRVPRVYMQGGEAVSATDYLEGE